MARQSLILITKPMMALESLLECFKWQIKKNTQKITLIDREDGKYQLARDPEKMDLVSIPQHTVENKQILCIWERMEDGSYMREIFESNLTKQSRADVEMIEDWT